MDYVETELYQDPTYAVPVTCVSREQLLRFSAENQVGRISSASAIPCSCEQPTISILPRRLCTSMTLLANRASCTCSKLLATANGCMTTVRP